MGKEPYIINLDPAVLDLPFSPNIDIRDTVDYKEVMKQYNLGPNGGILTSLNLFTTKFDQVLDLLQKRSSPEREDKRDDKGKTPIDTEDAASEEQDEDTAQPPISNIIIDTPGQIEIFTWSASGSIIMEALAAIHPTIIVYVVDTPRCARPATFMSNMLYACSILYKTRLPMVLVFNKTDVEPATRYLEWMQDVMLFQEALQEEEEGSHGQGNYMNSMVQSMSLVLEEFYKTLRVCAVSAFTGDGMDEFFDCVSEAVEEYNSDYLPVLQERMAQRQAIKDQEKTSSLTRLMTDMSLKQVQQDDDEYEVEGDEEESLENVD